MKKLSTENYKGVRDFYPEDQYILNYIFDTMRKTVESFGFVEYGASILENSEIYKEKTGEEIVNEQTYTFKDRGDREVTLRPEMTPTVARMIVKRKREISFPAKWYSIPNLFRYEKPQRGRLREHFQLNVDIFGVESLEADIETIKVAYKIMINFGAKNSDFIIKINNRKILKDVFEKLEITETESQKVSKILDKKEKISKDVFENSLREIVNDKAENLVNILENTEKTLSFLGQENKNVLKILQIAERLNSDGIDNIVISPTLMRGFDYYTETVFEVFDTDKENNRSLFGGGRYDDLTSLFDDEKIPAFGFGMGDVTARDFLETRNLLPDYKNTTKLHICVLSEEFRKEAFVFADKMRSKYINTSVDLTSKKISDQIKYADKNKIEFIICIGEDEVKTGKYKLKNLKTSQEFTGSFEEVLEKIK